MICKIPIQLFILLTLTLAAGLGAVSAQTVTVSGTVTNAEDGDPIPNVNIIIQGTTTGTATDVDGNYTLNNVPSDAVLLFSYIGMLRQEIEVDGRTEIDVALQPDAIGLEDIVVIGYGEARSIDLTAPISTVSSEQIARNTTTNAVSALQGAIPGLQVTDAGTPGSTPTIRVRGIGSMQGAEPLYVVDGMFYDDINWLSPNDIESISVLKDASAASIYGVRASGGVIMVSTKQGNLNQRMVIEYDGFVGFNTTSNLIEMANTEQYSMMLIEAGIPERLEPAVNLWGGQPFTHNGNQYTIPSTDTDWYRELLGSGNGVGPMMNHSLSLRGGAESVSFHVGASYNTEDGMFQNLDHSWERTNLKASINFLPYNFLDAGASINLNRIKIANPGNVWGSMYYAVPTIPVRNSDNTEDFAGVVDAGYNVGPVNNPAAQMYYLHQGNWNFDRQVNVDYNAFVNINFLGDDRLVLRTQLSHSLEFFKDRRYEREFFIDNKLRNENSMLRREYRDEDILHLDNTLTFRHDFGNHHLTSMAGITVRKGNDFYMRGSAANVPGGAEHYLYFHNAIDPSPDNFNITDGASTEAGLSWFGRLMYNYQDRYMVNATFRADGTDKYTQNWGYFPSFGVGWVASEESFMDNQSLFNFLKFRASWGQLGNNNVPRESGSRSIETGFGASYVFGNDRIIPGYRPSVFFNTLVWEITTETNIGVDISTLDYRLSAEIDWFRKITHDAAIWTSNLMGGGGLIRNQGEILNTGVEFNLSWQDQAGELGYLISGNLSTLHNEVLDLGGQPYIQTGDTQPYRSEPGHQLYSWYGYVVEGVYQNQQEIDAHLNTDIHSSVRPGFLRFEDLNGDGIIDENDRQHLGANIPKLTYGAQIQLDYKNFDFSTSIYGVYGNKIFNALRGQRSHHTDFNFDMDLVENRWTGEGTSNTHPSAEGMINAWNMNNMNTFLLEDGSFFRVQNITLGYTFHDLLPRGAPGSAVRFRITAQNPFTTFSFNGFTPEVEGVGSAAGVYPIPRSFTVGVNITY